MSQLAADTIAAIATPPGEGGIGVIRVSGPDALSLAARLFRGRVDAEKSRGYTVRYGRFIDPGTGETADDGLLTIFRAPHSYTGENSAEFACHGGRATTVRLLRLTLDAGARLAEPGEFTQRAFLNGKLDLAQAEAVADVIRARTETARRQARRQLEGALSRVIGEMRDAETIDTAIKAAETGHLLISTLHTPDAQSTILRIMAMFSPEEQEVVRIRLSETLNSVVSQRLLPRADGQGRAVAAEILIVTPAVRDMIADGKRIHEIRDYIADGRDQYGMQTFDQHLSDLVQSGEVTFDTAMAATTNPSDFELKMRMFRRVTTTVMASTLGAAPVVPSAQEPPASGLDGMTMGGSFDFMGQ